MQASFRNKWQKLTQQGVTRTLLLGTGGAFLANAAATVAAFVFHAMLANALGADEYGVFVFVLTNVTILLLIASLGMNPCVVRFVAEYNAEKDWSRFRGLLRRSRQTVFLGGLVVGSLYAAVMGILSSRIEPVLLHTSWVAAAMLPILALAGVNQSGLRGLKQVFRSQLPLLVLRPLLLTILVSVLCIGMGLSLGATEAMLLYAGAVIVSLVVGHAWLRRAVPAEDRRGLPIFETYEWLRVSLPLLLVSGMRVLLHNTDVLLIGILLGTTEAGIYGVATRLVRLMTFGLQAGNMIAAPMISELHAGNRHDDLQRTTYLASWVSTSVCLTIGTVLIVTRTYALSLFGPEFVAGANVLLILAVGQFVNACTGPVGNLLNMTGQQDVNARISIVITAANAALNYPAILAWGIEGAALVTSGLIAIKNVWIWWEVRRRLGINSSVFQLATVAKG